MRFDWCRWSCNCAANLSIDAAAADAQPKAQPDVLLTRLAATQTQMRSNARSVTL